MIPYGRHSIDDDDIREVVAVLRSDWLTTGPKVAEFEQAVAAYTGARYAVAVSNGTAGLHAAMFALGIGPGDEVIVPAMTFAASANCIVYQGGTPIFCDVDPDTLLIDPTSAAARITPRTRAIVAVDYAGQPCDYDRLHSLARTHGLKLVADACHSLGAEYRGRRAGVLADVTVFSFHPVKHITTGEGGMVTTEDPSLNERLRLFRNHGINNDLRCREASGQWHYEMVELGYNYRITDIQCALGVCQLKKLPAFLSRREEIAGVYDRAIGALNRIRPLGVRGGVHHAYHLYVVKTGDPTGCAREDAFHRMRAAGIGVNVHYLPVHLHSFYGKQFGYGRGLCPQAEAAYGEILSLPIHPRMTADDQAVVVHELQGIFNKR